MRVPVHRVVVPILAALTTLIAAPASAQTVDDIIAKHIQARGGYDKIKAIQTIKITRTVATPFSSVTVVTYRKRPDLLRIEQTPKGQPAAIPRGINATGAWDIIQGKPAMRPEKAAIEGREFDADIDGPLVDWKQKGHVVTLVGREPIAGNEAYKLKVVTKGGSERFIFIDAKTFMETAQSGKWMTPQVNPKTKELVSNESTWIFSDFRDVNGVKFPFSIDEDRIAPIPIPIATSFATFTEKIEVNVPVDEAMFSPPTGSGGR